MFQASQLPPELPRSLLCRRRPNPRVVVQMMPATPFAMERLGQASVRCLSAALLIDLWAVERDQALADDLLLAGASDDTLRVRA